MKTIKATFTITAALCSIVVTSQAALVVDGGFESPTATSPFSTYGIGSMGGWNVTAGTVDLISGYWPSPQGNQSLDLTGDSPGTISQSIVFSAGTYQLTFLMSGNQDGAPTTKTVEVSLTGAQTFSSSLSAQGSQWQIKTASFTIGTGGSYLLQFKDISNNGTYYGAALDDIQLAAVPEPTTMIAGALLLLPFGASTIRFFRKNRTA